MKMKTVPGTCLVLFSGSTEEVKNDVHECQNIKKS